MVRLFPRSGSVHKLIAEEIKVCLAGRYYTDELLNAACEMNATSVNIWYQTVSAQFIDKAHQKGLRVLVFTVNTPDDLQRLLQMGVDGIYTDCYSEAARQLAKIENSDSGMNRANTVV